MAIQISGCTVIDNSRNLVNTNIGEGAFISGLGPGTSVGGGFLICKSSSVAWVIAPYAAETSSTWYCRNDAVTCAQSVTGCTGWFIPTKSQLQNPGCVCQVYWDYIIPTSRYWSNTEYNAAYAEVVCMATPTFIANKALGLCVRAFRCVTY